MPDGSTTQETAPSRIGALPKGRKVRQVLDGAREVFLATGFEGANVDDIAQAAGVSKATLYSYFPDKRHLFLAVVKAECARQAEATLAAIDLTAPVHEVLRAAALHLVDLLLSDFVQRCHRTCLGEADRFPEVARAFYDSGPGLGRRLVAEYLDSAVARGEIVAEDTLLAADQFQALCKAGLHERAMFQVEPAPGREVRARAADEAVRTFLARFGA